MAVSEERLFKRVCNIDRGLLLHVLHIIKHASMQINKIISDPMKRYTGGSCSIIEQCVKASSIPDGQSSMPLHHTVALIQASNSGQRYWHSSDFIKSNSTPFVNSFLQYEFVFIKKKKFVYRLPSSKFEPHNGITSSFLTNEFNGDTTLKFFSQMIYFDFIDGQ